MGVTFSTYVAPSPATKAVAATIGLGAAPVHTDSCAHYAYNPGIESAMQFLSKFGDPVNMSYRYGDNIAIPRRFAPSLGIDNRADNFIGVCHPKIGPRDSEQARCLKESLALLNKGVDHIIESPTGSGKSMMGVLIAMALGRTTLIVVTKEDLVTGWIKNLKMAGIPEEEIGIAQADKLKYKGCRFVIGMIHSLSIRGKYDDDFLRYFGFTIFDEVHRSAADQFMVAAQLIPSKLRLGLSATPERQDGKDLVLRGHIGPILVRGTMIPMKPRVLLYDTGWEIPDYCKKYGPGQMMIVEKAMAYSEPRNALIARFVKQAFDAGRNTVVMSSNLVHLDKLQLAIGPLVGGENIGRYVGQMGKAELEIGSRRRVVLATYGMCVWREQELVNPVTGRVAPMHAFNEGALASRTENGCEIVPASDYFDSGDKPCLRVRHACGELVASEDHEVLTSEGFRPTREIKAGDVLVAPRRVLIEQKDVDLTEDDLWLLGAFIGDGCLSQDTPGFVSADPEVVVKAKAVLALHDMDLYLQKERLPHYYYRVRVFGGGRKGAGKKSWLVSVRDRFGLKVTAKSKHIPTPLMHLPPAKALALLAGLVDTDGYVEKRRGRLGFSCLNRAMVEQVKTLFERCGLLCCPTRWSGTVWTVSVLTQHARELHERLPLALTRKKSVLAELAKQSYGVSSLDCLPLSIVKDLKRALKARGASVSSALVALEAAGFKSSWLRLNQVGSYRAAQFLEATFGLQPVVPKETRFSLVLSVTSEGILPVGDVSVPEHENFVCGGAVAHNCAEGTDCPWWDTLVPATPRKNQKQINGRVMRSLEGKKEPVILDLLDKSPIYRAYRNHRLKEYFSVGANVVPMRTAA